MKQAKRDSLPRWMTPHECFLTPFRPPITCLCTCLDNFRSIAIGDLDGDGSPDVVVTFEFSDLVTWFRNTDGLGGFSTGIDISTDADGAAWVIVDDIDGDGDLDVVSASWEDGEFVRYVVQQFFSHLPRTRSIRLANTHATSRRGCT